MTSIETAAFETAEGAEHLTAHGDVRRRLLRRLWRERTGRVGLLIVASFALAAVLAPVLAPHDPNAVDVVRKFAPPSGEFPLGTDHLGRDVLSRLLFGARVSVATTLVAASLISLIGLVLGMLAGYLGGAVDTVISRVMDVVLAFPSLLLALAVTGVLGPGLRNVTIAVVVVWWAEYARLVRSAVIVVREKPYIEAARALGASRTRILGRHVLPNIVAPIVVRTTLELGLVLLGIAALSFLGLGVKAARCGMGVDALRRKDVPLAGAADDALPGRRHLLVGARVQPPRRRAARRPRSPYAGRARVAARRPGHRRDRRSAAPTTSPRNVSATSATSVVRTPG